MNIQKKFKFILLSSLPINIINKNNVIYYVLFFLDNNQNEKSFYPFNLLKLIEEYLEKYLSTEYWINISQDGKYYSN